MIRDQHSERLVEHLLPGGRVVDIKVAVQIEYDGNTYEAAGHEPSAVTWDLIRRIRNGRKEKGPANEANARG